MLQFGFDYKNLELPLRLKMMNSKSSLPIQQIYTEMHSIVKDSSQNDTSYFPNPLRLVEAFENYLECIDVQLKHQIQQKFTKIATTLFTQEICSTVLAKYGRFVHILTQWETSFYNEINGLINLKQNQQNPSLFALTQVSLVEMLFLMYFCLEIQRTGIVGNNLDARLKKNMIILKEVVKLLQRFSSQDEQNSYFCKKSNRFFLINEDKLFSVLITKAFQIKISRLNMNLKAQAQILTQNKAFQQLLQNSSQNLLESEENKQKNQTSLLLVSVQSQYEESKIYQNDQMKKALRVLPLKLNQKQFGLQFKYLSNDEMFKYISLGQSNGYFTNKHKN